MAIYNYAEHCTFIERQVVEHQVVHNMHVQAQQMGCDDEESEEKPAGKTLSGSPLSAYILDKELLQRVIDSCFLCHKPKDVAEKVLFLLKQSPIFDKQIMTGKTFIAALLPHLVNVQPKPDVKSIYEAIYRQI